MTSGKGYSTDLHEIVKKEVALHMRPFIEVTMQEHQATRDEVRELKALVCKVNSWNVNDIVQYAVIFLLIISMLLLH